MAAIARWVLLVLLTGISGCSPGGDKQPAAGPTLAAVEQWRQQAESGDLEAQWRLGSLYDSGRGVSRDGEEAKKWYRRAAEGGYADAQNSLGSISQAEHRYVDAIEWYQKAADQGHTIALNNLAYMYDLGLGTAQDRRRAFDLYMKAANQGEPEAMFNIAVVYAAGQLGNKDLSQSYIWTLRARRFRTNCFANNSKLNDRVEREIRYAEAHLSSDELEHARRMSADWSPQGTCE
jgi:tetratricopeptide (TPR) repeat protein